MSEKIVEIFLGRNPDVHSQEEATRYVRVSRQDTVESILDHYKDLMAAYRVVTLDIFGNRKSESDITVVNGYGAGVVNEKLCPQNLADKVYLGKPKEIWVEKYHVFDSKEQTQEDAITYDTINLYGAGINGFRLFVRDENGKRKYLGDAVRLVEDREITVDLRIVEEKYDEQYKKRKAK